MKAFVSDRVCTKFIENENNNMFRLLTFLNKILNIKLYSISDVVKEGLPNYYYPDDTGNINNPFGVLFTQCKHNYCRIYYYYPLHINLQFTINSQSPGGILHHF